MYRGNPQPSLQDIQLAFSPDGRILQVEVMMEQCVYGMWHQDSRKLSLSIQSGSIVSHLVRMVVFSQVVLVGVTMGRGEQSRSEDIRKGSGMLHFLPMVTLSQVRVMIGQCVLWDVALRQPIAVLIGHTDTSVAFSRDGSTLQVEGTGKIERSFYGTSQHLPLPLLF